MRKAILLLVLLAVATAAALLLGGHEGDPAREPRAEFGGYESSDILTWLGNTFAAPLAPRLALPNRPVIPLALGVVRRVAVPAASDRFRIARFRHAAGGVARIRYDCGTPPRDADRKTCRDQVLCVGAAGTSQPPGCTEKVVTDGRLMILASGGLLTLEALGGETTVVQR